MNETSKTNKQLSDAVNKLNNDIADLQEKNDNLKELFNNTSKDVTDKQTEVLLKFNLFEFIIFQIFCHQID